MKEQYKEVHEAIPCPKTGEKATHTVWLTKSTCTRFADEVLDFSCSLDPDCCECTSDYP